MSVGTTPLIIQLPDKAPINRRMIRAVVTPNMLEHIASSIFFHRTWQKSMDKAVQQAVVNSRTTWLPPLSASLPNSRMVKNKRTIMTPRGIKESPREGCVSGREESNIFMYCVG